MPRRLLALAVLFPLAASAAPGDDNWTTVNKDYSSQRYVDLDQITPKNVQNLKEVCEVDLKEASTFSSGILKVGHTLYITTPRRTFAIDAGTCHVDWQKAADDRDPDFLDRLSKDKSALAALIPHPAASTNNRGLGYLNGKLYRGTIDGRVIALDAATGEPAWPHPYDARIDHDWSGKLVVISRGKDMFTLLAMTYADSDLIQIQENVISRAIASLDFSVH